MMKPCPACKRHLHADERSCPFCGAEQRATSWKPGWGAVAFAAAVLGSTACAPGKATGDDEADATGEETSPDTTTGDESGTETSVTATGTEESTDDADDRSGSFYAGPGPDVGEVTECDPFLQDCPEGEKCVPYALASVVWDANKCVPVTGDGQPGDACISDGVVDATDDCGVDSVCFWADERTGVGECIAFCTGTAEDPLCAEGTACWIGNNGSLNLCFDTCDPLALDCEPEEACIYNTHEPGSEAFMCLRSYAAIPVGEPCVPINTCAAGGICLNGLLPDCGGADCCVMYCDVTDPEASAQCEPAGTECVAFFGEGEAPAGYEDVGVCATLPP